MITFSSLGQKTYQFHVDIKDCKPSSVYALGYSLLDNDGFNFEAQMYLKQQSKITKNSFSYAIKKCNMLKIKSKRDLCAHKAKLDLRHGIQNIKYCKKILK
ncbi:MAG: hypothetical protein U9N59_05050 [Campylobacterota bacterium]|nr:hypothetical protein [Campylobacterota bacterium]